MANESRRVMITAKEEWDEQPYVQIWDMEERLLELVLGFGNGVWVEIRIVAETQDALDTMRGLLTAGGYKPGRQPFLQTTLSQEGDECWAGFVFIDPSPRPLHR